MNFIEKYWLPLLFLGVIIFLLVNSQAKVKQYKDQIDTLNVESELLEERAKQDLKEIENLKQNDTVFVDRIREIIKETDENIKLVDTMSVSDMQGFFSDRYPVKE